MMVSANSTLRRLDFPGDLFPAAISNFSGSLELEIRSSEQGGIYHLTSFVTIPEPGGWSLLLALLIGAGCWLRSVAKA
jgi:hypothetical protein